MKARETAVILATGGMGLVPRRLQRRQAGLRRRTRATRPPTSSAVADVAKAVRDIVTGKTFDNGVLCSSGELGGRRRAAGRGGQARVRRQRRLLHVAAGDRRGRPDPRHAAAAAEPGARRPPRHLHRATGRDHRAGRHARADRGAGRRGPRLPALDREALPGPLVLMSSSDWREGCERCKQILRYGGMGHTMSIHCRNDDVILQFGLKKPAYRIVVNTPTTHGSIGLTTGLDPAMTLGCGGYGGNITSDNISPRHLLNIKRLAYEITPAVVGPAGRASRRASRPPAEGPGAPRPRRAGGRAAGPADRPVPGIPGIYGAGRTPALPCRSPRPRRPPSAPSASPRRDASSSENPQTSCAKTTSGRR